MFKKIFRKIEFIFIKAMGRISYKYYLKHYPLYLKKIGVRFSGDIANTGFIASSAKFDSQAYAKYFEIGENTTISMGVLMLVHDYSIGSAIRSVRPVKKGAMPHFIKEIKIGNNCFIGARAIILPGTTIGDNTIIGAGAVVKGNIPAGVVVAGNPGKIVKTVEEYANIHLEKRDFVGTLPEETE